jgi:hypothetical protein
MKLITKAIAAKIPTLYTNEEKSLAETKVPLKLFTPWANATWFITEMNVDTGMMFGYCDLGMGMPELGYVSMNELEGLRGPAGLRVERDRHWDHNTTLEAVMNKEVM